MKRVVLTLILAAFAALSAFSCSSSDDASGEPKCRKATVSLPAYPYAETDMTEVSQEFLDGLAADYACSLPEGQAPDGTRFLLTYAPLRLFNELTTNGPVNIKKTLWVLHISGYFGGVWLKASLNKFNGGADGDDDSGMEGMETPEDGGVTGAAAMAKEAADAANAGGDATLAYNDQSLYAFVFPDFGIASDFGYNKGYMMQIYEAPPAGLTNPPGFISCNGILWCDYKTVRMDGLMGLKAVSLALAGTAEPYASIGADVLKKQNASEKMGRQVWGSFLKYDGMTQDFYVDLLDISAAFLEVVQAAGLYSAKAIAEGDVESGKKGAYLQSGLIMWLNAYMGSFTSSPPPDAPLPKIIISE